VRNAPKSSDYAAVAILSAGAALLVAFGYARAHAEITTIEQAQGYVDPLLQTGITLGFFVMLAIVAILAAVAAWSVLQMVRTRKRR
jgi:hypothetical protein